MVGNCFLGSEVHGHGARYTHVFTSPCTWEDKRLPYSSFCPLLAIFLFSSSLPNRFPNIPIPSHFTFVYFEDLFTSFSSCSSWYYSIFSTFKLPNFKHNSYDWTKEQHTWCYWQDSSNFTGEVLVLYMHTHPLILAIIFLLLATGFELWTWIVKCLIYDSFSKTWTFSWVGMSQLVEFYLYSCLIVNSPYL